MGQRTWDRSRGCRVAVLIAAQAVAILLPVRFAAGKLYEFNGNEAPSQPDSQSYNSAFGFDPTHQANDWNESWEPFGQPGSDDEIEFDSNDSISGDIITVRSQQNRTVGSLYVNVNSDPVNMDFGPVNGGEYYYLLLASGDVTTDLEAPAVNIFGAIFNTSSANWDIGDAKTDYTAGHQFVVYGPTYTNGSFTKTGYSEVVLKGMVSTTGATYINTGRLSIGTDTFSSTYVYVGDGTGAANSASFDLSEFAGGTRSVCPIEVMSDGNLTLRGAQATSYLKADGGATMLFTGSTLAQELDLSNGGAVALNGPGTFTTDQVDTSSTSALTVIGATLVLQGAQFSNGSLAMSGSTLETKNSVTVSNLSGGSTIQIDSGSLTLTGASTTANFSGTVSGSGNLIQQNAGTVTINNLSNIGIFTGNIKVNSGILVLNNITPSTDLLPYGQILSAAGGTVELDNSAEPNVIAGSVIVGVTNDTTGGPTLQWLVSDQIKDSVTVQFHSGTLDLHGNNETIAGITASGSGAMSVQTGNGTLTLSGTSSAAAGAAVSVAGNIDLNGGTSTFSAAGDSSGNAGFTNWSFTGGLHNGTFDKTGVGTVSMINLSSNVTLQIDAGVIQAGHAIFGGLIGSGELNIVLPGVQIDNSATNQFDGVISGSGDFYKTNTGKLTLTGANTYTGNTNILDGTLAIAGTGNIADSATITVSTGAKLDVSTKSFYSIRAAQTLTGTGDVSGNIKVLGTVSGSLSISGTLSGSGIVSPGDDPGILTAASLNSGGMKYNFDFTHVGSPNYAAATNSGNDLLRLTGLIEPFTQPLTDEDTVNIYLASTANTNFGDSVRGGFFTDLDADFLAEIEQATFNYYFVTNGSAVPLNPANVTVELSTVPETADFADGSVAGQVMQLEFVHTPVPEPASLGLMSLCALSLMARRRKV